jgi:hypothetical protein
MIVTVANEDDFTKKRHTDKHKRDKYAVDSFYVYHLVNAIPGSRSSPLFKHRMLSNFLQ